MVRMEKRVIPKMKTLLVIVVLLGIFGVFFFGYFALQDWTLLRGAYAHLLKLTPSSSVSQILLAEAQQNAHRINVFADATWALLSAIFAAIGIHGLALLPREKAA
jgi:hypothetical protein